jgi:cytidylate kinase
MDGRDIGSGTPDAELKIFMTADIAIRVQKTFKEMFERTEYLLLKK